MNTPFIILTCLTTAIVVGVVVGVVVKQRLQKKINYMLDALEDKELNFRFNEQGIRNRSFNKTLNRLRDLFDKERHEISEQERYFGQMLDHVQTGIITVTDNRVTYHNKTALSLLGLLTFSNLRQLDNIHPSLAEAFRQVSTNSEQRATFFTERGERTIILTATEAAIHGKTIKIIAFNDISNEIAENEELAWSRLIRVLTHEIMNTITPIASLSETLSKDPASPDLVMGLQTISTSSKDLIKFVNTYRSLTRVATPVRKPFYLRELMERVEQLTKPQIDAAGANYQYTELTDDILLYADEGQISQVIVNLISNALQAEATQITITAQIDDADAVVIDVCNNGHPISPDSQEQIFIPFFTTKPEGSGIGLSLSRQIMRLHNGSIRLVRSDEKGTIFTLIFR